MIWPIGHQLREKQYEITKRLGGGGFGLTYLARDKSLGKDVVIKTPNRDLEDDTEYEKFLRRFSQEGQKLAKLSHAHIVEIWDFFIEGRMPCLVMEYVDGVTLSALIKQRGTLPEEEAVQYIRQIAEALCAVHQAGLVHCDAHPGNIMIQASGDAILIDFGTAKSILPTTQTSATTAWNRSFAPYEQQQGNHEPTVDIYTLAASLYFAVAGHKPTDSMTRKMKVLESGIEPMYDPKVHVPSISENLNRVILNGLSLEACNRPSSMREWLQELPVFSAKEETPQEIIVPSEIQANHATRVWPAGHKIGQYEIQRLMKSDGTVFTYLALEKSNMGKVVLKTLGRVLDSDEINEREPPRKLQREQQLIDFHHPNLARVLGLFKDAETPYLVRSYIEGKSLEEFIFSHGPMTQENALICFRQLASALHEVHQSNLIHYDINPRGIIIKNDNQPILINFSLSKRVQPEHKVKPTDATTCPRSTAFSAYERYHSWHYRPALDIYGLAASFYFAITGEEPTSATDRKVHNFNLIPPRQHVPTISMWLEDAILVGMALDPVDRPHSVYQWLQALYPTETPSSQITTLSPESQYEVSSQSENHPKLHSVSSPQKQQSTLREQSYSQANIAYFRDKNDSRDQNLLCESTLYHPQHSQASKKLPWEALIIVLIVHFIIGFFLGNTPQFWDLVLALALALALAWAGSWYLAVTLAIAGALAVAFVWALTVARVLAVAVVLDLTMALAKEKLDRSFSKIRSFVVLSVTSTSGIVSGGLLGLITKI